MIQQPSFCRYRVFAAAKTADAVRRDNTMTRDDKHGKIASASTADSARAAFDAPGDFFVGDDFAKRHIPQHFAHFALMRSRRAAQRQIKTMIARFGKISAQLFRRFFGEVVLRRQLAHAFGEIVNADDFVLVAFHADKAKRRAVLRYRKMQLIFAVVCAHCVIIIPHPPRNAARFFTNTNTPPPPVPTTPPIDDIRIATMREMPPPAQLINELPADSAIAEHIFAARKAAEQIISGGDDRLLVIAGPCSVHDKKAVLEYGERLAELARLHSSRLLVVMRVYFEKPRTTIGWKGLINDPHLDGSYAITEGLHLARGILLDLNRMGLSCGTEFLDAISPQYVADLIGWGAIGARTAESQVHREMASGLSCPVGFKNGTGGSVQIAADAIRSASQPHHFLAVDKNGKCAKAETRGNKHCHIILRGGKNGTNYDAKSVEETTQILAKCALPGRVMIDCSHANSGKDYRRQPDVAADIAAQISGGDMRIMGAMIESHLVEGCQEIVQGRELTYGQSVTDACIGWEKTEEVLAIFADAAAARQRALRLRE